MNTKIALAVAAGIFLVLAAALFGVEGARELFGDLVQAIAGGAS